MQIKDLMFALLRFEFFGVELSLKECETIRGLGEEEGKELFALSKKHDMAHAVANALINKGLLSVESPIYRHYAKEQMLSVFRYENQAHELEKIRSVLTENDIPFIPLKGAVIRKYYKDPSLRTGCDIDVLIKRNDLKKATKLLCDKLQYKLDKREYYHDVTLHSVSDVTIELHFSIKEGIKDMDAVLQNVWDYALPKKDGGVEYALTNEFLVFHVISHMAYHFIHGGCGIKPFMDLWVLGKTLKIDQSKLNVLLQEAKLTKFYGVMSKVVSVIFDDDRPTDTVEHVIDFILQGGVYGAKEKSVVIASVKSGSRVKYFFSRVFLPYSTLKNVFPVLEKQKWLFPFCQVARWFKIVFSKRVKTATKELAINATHTKEESEQTKTLLDELGL